MEKEICMLVLVTKKLFVGPDTRIQKSPEFGLSANSVNKYLHFSKESTDLYKLSISYLIIYYILEKQLEI